MNIFSEFLKAGCLSFGGPAAHLVIFQKIFVQQLNWLNNDEYAQLVALSQLLPGPTSSQTGIAIGYVLKGYSGALVAWLGFTLPSAVLMTAIALTGQHYFSQIGELSFHIIQLTVLVVVCWAFWQMLLNFCQTTWQYVLMLLSALFVYFYTSTYSQMMVILLAAGLGIFIQRIYRTGAPPQKTSTSEHHDNLTHSGKRVSIWLLLFTLPFITVPLYSHFSARPELNILYQFYEAASLVFGGGHIILPLLHQDFVSTGLISAEQFDLGYAFAQLMPGPLFSFASYLGAILPSGFPPLTAAALATVAVFLPSFLLIFATLPSWKWLMSLKNIHYAVTAINAAVVGLLLCMMLHMGNQHIRQWTDLLFIVVVILGLKSKLPVWICLPLSFCLYLLYLQN